MFMYIYIERNSNIETTEQGQVFITLLLFTKNYINERNILSTSPRQAVLSVTDKPFYFANGKLTTTPKLLPSSPEEKLFTPKVLNSCYIWRRVGVFVLSRGNH